MNEKKLVISGVESGATLACIARSRKYKQYVRAVENALGGICPFCKPDPDHNKMIAVPGVEHLWVWHCNPPEKHTKLHLLAVPKRHVLDSSELTDNERRDIWSVADAIPRIFGFKFRGWLMRDGDATQSAGTIQHLHMHFMVPDGTGRVESPFCKTPEEEAAGVARAIVFEKMRTGTSFESLLQEEKALIQDRM